MASYSQNSESAAASDGGEPQWRSVWMHCGGAYVVEALPWTLPDLHRAVGAPGLVLGAGHR